VNDTINAKLTLEKAQLEELRHKHGKEFEVWWQERFGYSFDRLTQSEARYLTRSLARPMCNNAIAFDTQIRYIYAMDCKAVSKG
jgi:hypothetical protein